MPFLPNRPRGRNRRGFTILEVLVVLALIGLLAGVLVRTIGSNFGAGQSGVADLFVKSTIKGPLMAYRLAVGDYPSTSEGLAALVAAPSGKADRWRGPYFDDGKVPVDPWGEPYQYVYPGTKNPAGYDVWSKGKDKVTGTADDIGNW